MPLADIPLAEIAVEQAISELARVEGSVQLRGQADQLAAHLRERQRQLEHRESQVNARVAAFEQEIRDARAWLARRNDELNEREARLEARETATKVPDAGISSQTASEVDSLIALATGPAASSALDTGHGSGLPGDAEKVTKPTAGRVSRAVPASFDGPMSFGEPLSFGDPVSFEDPVSFDGPLSETNWQERKRTLTHASQQLDRRRQALEELHDEVSQMHQEALELHLATQELQAQLRPSLGADAEEALRAAREKMTRRYHKDAAQLMRQRKELEWLRSDLAKEHAKLQRRYQELRGWIENQRACEVAGKEVGDPRGARPVA
jgi:predicted  nucleic acid-binding Zn-ribbon protein